MGEWLSCPLLTRVVIATPTTTTAAGTVRRKFISSRGEGSPCGLSDGRPNHHQPEGSARLVPPSFLKRF